MGERKIIILLSPIASVNSLGVETLNIYCFTQHSNLVKITQIPQLEFEESGMTYKPQMTDSCD